MHKLRWVVLSMLGWLLLLACSAESPAPTAAPANTAVPPTATPSPTQPATIEQEADTSPAGVTVSGYTNVVFTETDADQLGIANRAQLLNVYATW